MTLFSSPLVRALAAINLLILIGGGLYILLYDGQGLPDAAPRAEGRRVDAPAPLKQRRAVEGDILAARPIFHQTRKPHVAEKAAPVIKQQVSQVNPLTAYQLKGIVYINKDKSIVILQHKGSGENFKLNVGEIIEGWTVAAVGRGAVEFTSGGARERLDLIETPDREQ